MTLNYEATAEYYKTNGMEVYSITTAEQYSELKIWLTSLFGEGSGAGIWIDALLNNGQWVTSDGKPLFSGAIPTKHLGEGNCAMISNFYGSFELIVRDCAITLGSIGEFFDVTKKSFVVRIPIDPEMYSCGMLNFPFQVFNNLILFRNIFALRRAIWNQRS